MGKIDFNTRVKTLSGEETDLNEHQGKVLLIVNTASHCGFTPQYEGLEELYRKHAEQGFTVLGFPSNQFFQEQGSSEEIQNFCQTKFNISFPLYEKVAVNGDETHPLFRQLKEAAHGALGSTSIKWNFTKFLVDRNGNVIKRFAPSTTPKQLEHEIEAFL